MYYLRNKSYIEDMTWFYNNLLDLLTNAITAVVVKLLLCYYCCHAVGGVAWQYKPRA